MSDPMLMDRTEPRESVTPTGWSLIGRLEPGAPIQQIPILGSGLTIGRRETQQLCLNSMCVSGRHAELLVVGQHLFIRDLGSTNGTFVNHERLRRIRRICDGDHVEIADVEFRVVYSPVTSQKKRADPELKKTSTSIATFEPDWIFSQFDRLIRDREVVPFFQSIVRLSDLSIIGYEALARSPLAGLQSPQAMFEIASLTGREADLSATCREVAIEAAGRLDTGDKLFLNTHPSEHLFDDVIPSLRKAQESSGSLPVVVEVHEGAVTDVGEMHEFSEQLRELRIELAYDDFGAGQSRLIELAKCPPRFLKFDRCLIENIDSAGPHHLRMVKTLVDMAREFETATLAEGVETAAEAQVCRSLGFDYAQGFYFARPMEVDAILKARA